MLVIPPVRSIAIDQPDPGILLDAEVLYNIDHVHPTNDTITQYYYKKSERDELIAHMVKLALMGEKHRFFMVDERGEVHRKGTDEFLAILGIAESGR